MSYFGAPYVHSPGVGTMPAARRVPPPRPPRLVNAPLDGAGAVAPPEPGFEPRTPEELLALARQLASIQLQPAYDQIGREQAYANERYGAQIDRANQLASALHSFLGGFDIKGPYQASARRQEAFGTGYAHGLQILAQKSADAANADMTKLADAPDAQKIPGSQAKDSATVLAAVGGGIPAKAFRKEGAAWQQGFGRFDADTDAQRLLDELTARSQLSESTRGFADALSDLAKQNPLVVAQYLDELYGMERQDRADYENTQAARKNEAMGLYDAGLLTQRELAQRLGLPNPGRYQPRTKDQLTAAAPEIRTVGNKLLSLDPRTGRPTVIYDGGSDDTGPPKTFTGPDGAVYAWGTDKQGNWRAQPITGPKPTTAKPPDTVSGPDGLYSWKQTKGGWQLVPIGPRNQDTNEPSAFQHVEVGGRTYVFDPDSGTFYDPQTGQPTVPKNSPARGVTQATISKGWQALNQGRKPYWALRSDPSTPLTNDQLRGIIGDYNKATGDTVTLADLPKLTAQERADIGIGNYQAEPQELYLHLVRDIGIPSRRAWQMVRRYYPTWGQGYYRPKADAPAGTGAGLRDAGLAEAFYDPLGSWDNGKFGGAIGNHSDHVHLSITNPQTMLTAIQVAQSMGLRVGENPYVDKVDPVHVNGSFHYKTFPGKFNGRKLGEAIDVSGTPEQMAAYYRWATGGGGSQQQEGVPPIQRRGASSATLPETWAVDVLTGIGAPVTAENVAFLNAWQRREGGATANTAYWNPLNTTQRQTGSSSMNSVGVQAFPDWNSGLRATLRTLRNYRGIVAMLRTGRISAKYPGVARDFLRWSGNSYTFPY